MPWRYFPWFKTILSQLYNCTNPYFIKTLSDGLYLIHTCGCLGLDRRQGPSVPGGNSVSPELKTRGISNFILRKIQEITNINCWNKVEMAVIKVHFYFFQSYLNKKCWQGWTMIHKFNWNFTFPFKIYNHSKVMDEGAPQSP